MVVSPFSIILEMIFLLLTSAITTMIKLFLLVIDLVFSLGFVSSLGGNAVIIISIIIFGTVIFFIAKFIFGAGKQVIILIAAAVIILLLLSVFA